LLFGFITWLGFAAAHWRRGDFDQLHEWGLGGRRFGTLITWFLLGGDIYTAYTFIAVPALAFGAGAIAFFAVPYTHRPEASGEATQARPAVPATTTHQPAGGVANAPRDPAGVVETCGEVTLILFTFSLQSAK
jgi:hypothetical protein